MKKMCIYEPALCCETGLCGVNVDPELLRISTALNTLKNEGVVIERYNLNNAPMEFVKSSIVNQYVNEKGVDGLPVVTVDGCRVPWRVGMAFYFNTNRKELSKKDTWTVMTLVVDENGNFKADYEYKDISEDLVGYYNGWKNRYLR